MGKNDFQELRGKTLKKVDVKGTEEILFECDDGMKYKMYHSQDCCEEVRIEDIDGDLQDLIGSPILRAEVLTNSGGGGCDTYTWTFYSIANINAWIKIRWYGASNSYYSEEVDFIALR